MNIRYIQFEPGWIFQAMMGMQPEERSVFSTLVTWLYTVGGQGEYRTEKLAALCGIGEMEFGRIWSKICLNFVRKNEVFFHKIIKKDCRRARKLLQIQKRAGLTGAEKRWGRYSDPKANVNVNVNVNKNTNTSTKSTSQLATDSLRLQQAIYSLIKPQNESDRAAMRNLCRWAATGIIEGRFNDEIYRRIIDYAVEARTGRKPIACFFASLKTELGYTPKSKGILIA
jgi:hypothetical protein